MAASVIERDATTDHAPLRTWLRLLACSTLVEGEVRRRLRRRFGVTLPQFDVLAQLDAAVRDGHSGMTMSALSRRLMVTNGNLTGIVERLAEEGLVSRATSATDRRIQVVALTRAGKRTLDTMTPEHERWIEELFAGLSPADHEHLHDLLAQMRGSVRRAIAPLEAT